MKEQEDTSLEESYQITFLSIGFKSQSEWESKQANGHF